MKHGQPRKPHLLSAHLGSIGYRKEGAFGMAFRLHPKRIDRLRPIPACSSLLGRDGTADREIEREVDDLIPLQVDSFADRRRLGVCFFGPLFVVSKSKPKQHHFGGSLLHPLGKFQGAPSRLSSA